MNTRGVKRKCGYEGDLDAHGRKHGVGTMCYSNGDWYVGEWARGRRHGIGRYMDAAGDILDGRFVAGLPECAAHPVGATAEAATCWCMHAPGAVLDAMQRSRDALELSLHTRQFRKALADLSGNPRIGQLHALLLARGAIRTLKLALARSTHSRQRFASSLHRNATAALGLLGADAV